MDIVFNCTPVRLLVLMTMLFVCSCSSENMERQETDGVHTCRLVWDDDIVGFADGTRAGIREMKNGDCVYLYFKVGSATVDGKAVYNAASKEWTLTYNGSIANGMKSSCAAWFFDGVVEDNATALRLGDATLVCTDMDAEYIREEGVIKLAAHLTPATGRIRFKGMPGQTFMFSGVKTYTGFVKKSAKLEAEQTPKTLTVAEDGYTPYVNAMPLADRTLTIYYDFQTYRTSCDSPILDTGKSGYMLLPAETAHNGWSLVKVELPTLSAVTTGVISDMTAVVNATVASLGSGTLLDAGFVYAETRNPTLQEGKMSCGAVTVLSTTLTGLKPVTKYYVRAYATNERGTNYGAQIEVTTTATPTVPKVTTGVVTGIQHNRATASATLDALGEVSQIAQHGHVWSTDPNPTTADFKTQLGATSALGSYTSTLSGLQPNTKYYVRAYAINDVGTSFGEQQTFTTPYGSIALSVAVTDAKYNEAVIKGTLTETGGHAIVERGICWSASTTPTVADNTLIAATTAAEVSLSMTGLAQKTTYYVCAYVRVGNGETFYSQVLTFTTPAKDEPFVKDDFGEDENWSAEVDGSGAEIEKGDDFGSDEDWTP